MTTFYMHKESGDVASKEDWMDDFNSMDVESWFGKPAEECEGLDPINDQKYLIEVEKDVNGDWVGV